jgi:dTDP-4-dehydrorhamnose reductase
LVQNLPVKSPSDSLFSPTFIDDAVHAIQKLVTGSDSGLWNIGSKKGISPFTASRNIAKLYGFDPALIGESSYGTFYEGRAHVPKNGVLASRKALEFGCSLHTFEEGIKEVKRLDTEI